MTVSLSSAVRRATRRLLVAALLVLGIPLGAGQAADDPEQPATDAQATVEIDLDAPWAVHHGDGEVTVNFYFFWSETCPHCRDAWRTVVALAEAFPWLTAYQFEVSRTPTNAALYETLAARAGGAANAVPGFIFCGDLFVGFDSPETTGAMLRESLVACRDRRLATGDPIEPSHETAAPEVVLALVGRLDPRALSLPVLTVVLGGLDAFNPCAFFVLLFLLSLMVHLRSRARMALVGGVFVAISGIVYFLFMAAWLNLFVLVGHARAVTAVAGAIAVVLALLNVKDFFWYGRGPTLSIPDGARPRLFDRMRLLLGADKLPALLLGTVVLALLANSYELLCTAGFPLVFTRILTLDELSPLAHYGYLALYNLVYVTPLLAIVAAFTATLGSRRLGEQGGRTLKLLSGLMMLGLGIILLWDPGLLENVLVAVALIAAAAVTTFVLARVQAVSGK